MMRARAFPFAAGKLRLAAIRVAALAAALALAGCLESADVTFFKPGVYQGAADPFLGKSDSAALQARFQKQTDR